MEFQLQIHETKKDNVLKLIYEVSPQEDGDTVLLSSGGLPNQSRGQDPLEAPVPSPKEEECPVPLKPFVCSKCDSTFASYQKLKNHYGKDHWDKTPCSICQKVLTTATTLRYHRIEVHSLEDEGPFFECEGCLRRFATEGRLKDHVRKTHSRDNNDFDCDVCGKAYSEKYKLIRHMRAVHMCLKRTEKVGKPCYLFLHEDS